MMRYLFIVLFICSSSPVYAGSKPSWSYEQRLLESDRLFLDWYVGYFFYSAQNPALKQLGSDLSKDPTVTHGAGSDIALRKHNRCPSSNRLVFFSLHRSVFRWMAKRQNIIGDISFRITSQRSNDCCCQSAKVTWSTHAVGWELSKRKLCGFTNVLRNGRSKHTTAFPPTGRYRARPACR